MTDSLIEQAKNIKLLILDMDGVLTDGKLHVLDDGIQFKSFNCYDGVGIKLLQKTGIEVAIITTHGSTLVDVRTRQLGITHVYKGAYEKIPAYEDLLKKLNLHEKEVAYVGDDLPDLPLIRRVGLGIAVNNAVDFVKSHAHWVTKNSGGNGAVREVCEFLMSAQGTLQGIQESYL